MHPPTFHRSDLHLAATAGPWPLAADTANARSPCQSLIVCAFLGPQECREDFSTEEEHPSWKQGAPAWPVKQASIRRGSVQSQSAVEVVSAQGLTLKRHIEATLGSGNIREAVRLPPGEDLCEWLAVNTVDFYNALSVLYGTLEEFCTKQSCPVMTAGPKVHPLMHASLLFTATTIWRP